MTTPVKLIKNKKGTCERCPRHPTMALLEVTDGNKVGLRGCGICLRLLANVDIEWEMGNLNKAPTTIIIVMNAYGEGGKCLLHPNNSIFEIVEGPYIMRRGCVGCLRDLVGDVEWDETRYSDYETYEMRKMA